jgi:SAM-dependent methyltransferase
MINHAEGLKKRSADYSNVHLSVVDGTGSIPHQDNFFSFIFSVICFQHIPYKEPQLKYIEEVERILKPGGVALLMIQTITYNKRPNPDIGFGRGLSREELKSVIKNLTVTDLPPVIPANDGRNYWVTLKK